MARRIIEKIREAIRSGEYDFTFHAMEEMADDDLNIFDVENAILHGKVIRKIMNDPRGTKYIICGKTADSSIEFYIIGRFKETGIFLIITVYRII